MCNACLTVFLIKFRCAQFCLHPWRHLTTRKGKSCSPGAETLHLLSLRSRLALPHPRPLVPEPPCSSTPSFLPGVAQGASLHPPHPRQVSHSKTCEGLTFTLTKATHTERPRSGKRRLQTLLRDAIRPLGSLLLVAGKKRAPYVLLYTFPLSEEVSVSMELACLTVINPFLKLPIRKFQIIYFFIFMLQLLLLCWWLWWLFFHGGGVVTFFSSWQ